MWILEIDVNQDEGCETILLGAAVDHAELQCVGAKYQEPDLNEQSREEYPEDTLSVNW